jgi:hypothetical protein
MYIFMILKTAQLLAAFVVSLTSRVATTALQRVKEAQGFTYLPPQCSSCDLNIETFITF